MTLGAARPPETPADVLGVMHEPVQEVARALAWMRLERELLIVASIEDGNVLITPPGDLPCADLAHALMRQAAGRGAVAVLVVGADRATPILLVPPVALRGAA